MTDLILEGMVSGLIEYAKVSKSRHSARPWHRGRKLKLLFAGYNGMRNTGSDVRVEEMLRHLRHILGAENVEFSVLTQNFALSQGYFKGTQQVFLPDVFPFFLFREVSKNDGVVACEGSMFKSKFANALATMMIGSLGIASSQRKLSVGYGAEAGRMDLIVAKMCARYCKKSLIVTRNKESEILLEKYNVPTKPGTDTGWTFEPHPPEYGRAVLREAGWDGRTPLLTVCPINPFWWPVKASVIKWALRSLTGAYKESHYRTIYFHRSGAKVNRVFERYLTSVALGIEAFRKARKVFVVIVGTEALDHTACVRLSDKLGGTPIFTANNYDMYQLVSILRAADMIVSSRYHAIVTSMPALVPSAGITMDERIRNLMRERGHEHLLMNVDDSDLDLKLTAALESLYRDREAIKAGIGRTVVANLRVMARMGMYFQEEVQRFVPEFSVRKLSGWEQYLPPLSPTLRGLLEEYDFFPDPCTSVGKAEMAPSLPA